MQVNRVRNVNEALAEGLDILTDPLLTARENTRNGAVTSCIEPVTTVTARPMERVLFSPYRNANPFFHLFESFWMLAGRNDLPWLAQFNKQMVAYSDDGGKTQPAAYGHRWRVYAGYDQLEAIVAELKARPNSRRAVLAMWDGGGDRDNNILVGTGDLVRALNGSKDVPCNTHCYFRIDPAGLHMMVCCRSNDVIWGAHGANAVHFSVLLEYLAARLGEPVGTMTQMSWNYHIYDNVLKYPPQAVAADARTHDHYSEGTVKYTPIFDPENVGGVHEAIAQFCAYAEPGAPRQHIPASFGGFFLHTALPMLQAWDLHKADDINAAIGKTYEITGTDWELACRQWLKRVKDRSEGK